MVLTTWPAAVVMAAAVLGAEDPEPTPRQRAIMAEYWRQAPKHGCLACTAYIPGPKDAAVPRTIGSVPVCQPRLYDTQARLACYAAGGRGLWAAADAAVYQIDTAKRAMARTFTVADGLPDAPVRQILLDGKWLWIVGAGRLARLDVAAGRIEAPAQPAFAVARMARGPAGTLLVTEQAAYRWNAAAATFESLGPYPGQRWVAAAVERGFWQFDWRGTWESLLRGAAVGTKGFYVVAENTLSRAEAGSGWQQLSKGVWSIVPGPEALWAVTTGGVLRVDDATGKAQAFAVGQGPAAGLPIDVAVGAGAAYLLVEAVYNSKAKQFAGGGICRLDPAGATWDNTARIADTDVCFPAAAAVAGEDVLVAVRRMVGVDDRVLHPGMAKVRRRLPRIDGLAVAVRRGARPWELLHVAAGPGRFRWVIGQKNEAGRDRVHPQRVSHLAVCGDRLWAVCQNFPENYFAGYYPTVQCVARRAGEGWQAVEDRAREDELALAGEHPDVMCLSATHGSPIVRAHGHPDVLGLVCCAGTTWVIHTGGIYAHDPSTDAFQAVLTVGYRAYWKVTAGAWDGSALWLGTDAGTVTRFAPAGGAWRIVGVAPGRAVAQLRAGGGKVWLATAPSKALLPPQLETLPKLPEGRFLCYDGTAWSPSDAASAPPEAPAPPYAFQGKAPNFLTDPDKRNAAFVKGVFQPKVLCSAGPRTLWIAVWGGVGRLDVPAPQPQPGERRR